ncbi:MAG: LysR family transcriptional regulator, partial [Sphingomonas sp.]|nr:LysR family transcriptional regulator [Sphingomonas sp.]
MEVQALKTLLDLDRRGSLSAVAKHEDVAVSTIARRLDSLEAALGLRLLDRRANGVRLTVEGQRIAALAEPIVDQAARIDRAAMALKASARGGCVTISATEFVVSEILAPALPDLWRDAPGLAVTLRAQGDVVSLAARAADLAIRMSRPTEPSLVAQKVG